MKSFLQGGETGFRYRVASILVLAVGIVLSITAFVAIHASEQDVAQAAFEKAALNRASVIKSALDRSVETVTFVAALFDSADSVERG